eukprot:scaffold1220_cov259-Pinguiococcus_pyrenoidosus.AAC.83
MKLRAAYLFGGGASATAVSPSSPAPTSRILASVPIACVPYCISSCSTSAWTFCIRPSTLRKRLCSSVIHLAAHARLLDEFPRAPHLRLVIEDNVPLVDGLLARQRRHLILTFHDACLVYLQQASEALSLVLKASVPPAHLREPLNLPLSRRRQRRVQQAAPGRLVREDAHLVRGDAMHRLLHQLLQLRHTHTLRVHKRAAAAARRNAPLHRHGAGNAGRPKPASHPRRRAPGRHQRPQAAKRAVLSGHQTQTRGQQRLSGAGLSSDGGEAGAEAEARAVAEGLQVDELQLQQSWPRRPREPTAAAH